MTHWLKTVIDLLDAETSNLRELAKLAGADPRTFYVGAKMDGVNLEGQDLRGMKFSNLNTERIQINEDTKIDLFEYYTDNRETEYVSSPTDSSIESLVGEKWTQNWHNRWQKNRSTDARSALAEEAADWLATNEPNNEYWASTWQTVWLSERRNSPRRNRLFETALEHLSQVKEGRINWLSVWQRLWKHTNEADRVPLESFLGHAITWFGNLNYNSPDWSKTWRQMFKASRSTKQISPILIEIALRFLQENPNHITWSSVWRDIWLTRTEANKHELIRLALVWLVEVDDRHHGWPSVWRRLWNSKDVDPFSRGTLVSFAERWLDQSSDSSAWPWIWLQIYETLDARREREWLAEIADAWLAEANLKEKDWPIIWCRTWDIRKAEVRENLIKCGSDWLNTHLDRYYWIDVWQRLWEFDESEEGRQNLRNLADIWRIFHDVSSHAFEIELEVASLQKSVSSP